MARTRTLWCMLITALVLSALLRGAGAADRPLVDAVVDRDSGVVLWSITNPTAVATLKPGPAAVIGPDPRLRPLRRIS